jgi:hypothetical protein
MGLVHVAAATDPVQGKPGRIRQQRREPPHPPVHRDVINIDPALGQQLVHIPIRQAESEVPAHRKHDHLGREPETGKRRARRNP